MLWPRAHPPKGLICLGKIRLDLSDLEVCPIRVQADRHHSDELTGNGTGGEGAVNPTDGAGDLKHCCPFAVVLAHTPIRSWGSDILRLISKVFGND